MTFESQKQDFLCKKDKSKKGEIDSQVKELIDTINSCDNYFTTSSCAGRIVLLRTPESGRKCDAEWIFKTHELANLSEVKKALESEFKDEIWLRMEPCIIHVCCRTMEDADKLIITVRQAGFKKSGIISASNKIMVELMNTERLETPVYSKKLLVTDDYLEFLIKTANEKLEITWNKIEKLKNLLK